MEGSGSVQIIPDPGSGSNTYGSYGSGSRTSQIICRYTFIFLSGPCRSLRSGSNNSKRAGGVTSKKSKARLRRLWRHRLWRHRHWRRRLRNHLRTPSPLPLLSPRCWHYRCDVPASDVTACDVTTLDDVCRRTVAAFVRATSCRNVAENSNNIFISSYSCCRIDPFIFYT